ncbi:26S proteasome non ATPase regulatory subunit 3 [Trichuris trichiura]|uniref:26S proteasome non ATPase regulatory subunit 3 n=1 Tax=Trichuris trichiura TaxID=36087 RepID=A0A077ZDU4_TRITR|nr:26S proteasome non ATPase regulatory subunit 3 [Trichuris trichiura]
MERAEEANVPRFANRTVRGLTALRKEISSRILVRIINFAMSDPSAASLKADLLNYLKVRQKRPQDGKSLSEKKVSSSGGHDHEAIPEVEAYLRLLVILFLAQTCAQEMIYRCEKHNRRSLDALLAKAYFYYTITASSHEKVTTLMQVLQKGLRTATLHHDVECQASLINCLLRIYISESLIELADALTGKVVFPDEASSNEWARFHYYYGRVKAVDLEYDKAECNFLQALRKSPQNGAIGFRRLAQKFMIVVQLLAGSIPELHVFQQQHFRRALLPYKSLAKAVRIGSLDAFDSTLESFKNVFVKDNTYTLIIRLRPNVIKAAVRGIALVYSRIGLEAVRKKLGLSSTLDAEYVMAKAISEGMVEAEINHEEGYVRSKELLDVYSTTEPRMQFSMRAVYCFELFAQAMKAMRFPPKSYSKSYETAEEKREKEQQELEFAKEMAEEDEDFP